MAHPDIFECNDYGQRTLGIPPTAGVTLPNFRITQEIDENWVVGIIDASRPLSLRYRGYVPNRRFTWGFEDFETTVHVDLESKKQPLASHIQAQLPRKTLDAIRAHVRTFIEMELQLAKGTFTTISAGLIALRALEEATSYYLEYDKGLSIKQEYWDLTATKSLKPILDYKLGLKGVDLETVQGAADHILGKTPAQILNDVLPEWRILHCENILRKDLQDQFLEFQQDLAEKLMRMSFKDLKQCVPLRLRNLESVDANKQRLIDELVKPRLTFHGTRRRNLPSIIQHGFLAPGATNPVTGKRHEVTNGVMYGRGIYSSPEAWYALQYADNGNIKTKPWELPGIKLLVCATIMGRAVVINTEDRFWEREGTFPGADSHVNPSLLAYVVFTSAAILPCYILHLDCEAQSDDDIRNFLTGITNVPMKKRRIEAPSKLDGLLPGDKQRAKEERQAQGRKFFAYGFGPVRGDKIEILDIADIDDDEEEEYGDYTMYRAEREKVDFFGPAKTKKDTSVWEWNLKGESIFDEFGDARKAKVNKRMQRSPEDPFR